MCGEFCYSSGTILGQETLTVLLRAPGQPANLVPLFFKLEVPKGAWKVNQLSPAGCFGISCQTWVLRPPLGCCRVSTPSCSCSSADGSGWLLVSVSFLMGMCLCDIFFHSLTHKATSSRLPKTRGTEKSISHCIRIECLLINSGVLFFYHEFRSCLCLFNIADTIATKACFSVAFLFHNCSESKTFQSIPLHPAQQDGDRGELLFDLHGYPVLGSQ